MSDDEAVRVAVESDDEAETARIHGSAGEVEVDGATVRVSVSGAGEGTDRADDDQSGPAPADADGDPRFVAPLSAVPVAGTLRVEALADGRGREVVLRREGAAVVAWRNSCPHKPEVRLDPGDGAIVTDDHLVCHEHGARFERGEGTCTAGPCQGAALDAVAVAVREEAVYLTDERFDAARVLE